MGRHIEWIVTRDVVPDADRPRARPAWRDDVAGGAVERGLAPGRLTELRRRVRDGMYDSRAVVEEVARRILEREGL